jgi:hypothetical protein
MLLFYSLQKAAQVQTSTSLFFVSSFHLLHAPSFITFNCSLLIAFDISHLLGIVFEVENLEAIEKYSRSAGLVK